MVLELHVLDDNIIVSIDLSRPLKVDEFDFWYCVSLYLHSQHILRLKVREMKHSDKTLLRHGVWE